MRSSGHADPSIREEELARAFNPRPEIRSADVSLRTELADDLRYIEGDAIQLEQVLMNLVLNAIEAMRACSEGPRDLLLCPQNRGSDQIVIAVRYWGVGIDSPIRWMTLSGPSSAVRREDWVWALHQSLDRGGSRRSFVGRAECGPWCDVSVHPSGLSRNTKGKHDWSKHVFCQKESDRETERPGPDWEEAMVRMAVMQLGNKHGTWRRAQLGCAPSTSLASDGASAFTIASLRAQRFLSFLLP